MRKTKIITFCALMAALSVTILLLGNLLEVLDLTTVIITALFILIAREEIGNKSFGVYVTTLVIAVILLSNKLIAVEYGVICLYPYLKTLFDKMALYVRWLVKLIYFLVGALAMVLVMKVFTPDSPHYLDIAFLVAFIVVFLLYDRLLFKFVLYYRFKLRNKLRLDKFFNQK